MSKTALTIFLFSPLLMAGSIYFAIPKKGRAVNATALTVVAPAPAKVSPAAGVPASNAAAAPAKATASGGNDDTGKQPSKPAAKGVRPETLKQGYIIRVKDLTGLASPDSPIYLAHSHNGWDPGSKKFLLQARSDMSWEIIMTPAAADSAMEFKFTRGSWETEELTTAMASPANRMLPEVDAKFATNGEKPEFVFEIPKWGDQRPNVQARADVNPYYYLAATGTVKRLEVVGGTQSPFKRDVLVWLPPGYDAPENAERRYPVLYMADGQNIFQKHPAIPAEWGVDETATKLIGEGAVEPLIIVGIPHAGKLRIAEYLPPINQDKFDGENTAQGGVFVEWLTGAVMPRVERAFRVRKGPESTGIGGSSMGGLIALYAGAKHPEVFGRVLAESPSMTLGGSDWNKWLFSQSKAWPAKMYLAVGGKETGKPDSSERYAGAVTMFNRSLADAGVGEERRRFVVDADATHNEEAWAKRFPDALKFLFPAK